MKSHSKKSHPVLTVIFSIIGVVFTHFIYLSYFHYPRESTFVLFGIVAIALFFTKRKDSGSKPH